MAAAADTFAALVEDLADRAAATTTGDQAGRAAWAAAVLGTLAGADPTRRRLVVEGATLGVDGGSAMAAAWAAEAPPAAVAEIRDAAVTWRAACEMAAAHRVAGIIVLYAREPDPDEIDPADVAEAAAGLYALGQPCSAIDVIDELEEAT